MLRRVFILALIILAPLFARPVAAADWRDVCGIFAGVSGAWLDGPGAAFPADVEAFGAAAASLQPHISVIASTSYGFTHSYFRGDGGVRFTATDVDNPDFNVYLGVRYRWGSTADMRPNEWAPDAGLGWKPAPETWPNFQLAADAGYGLQSNRMLTYVRAMYSFPLK